MKTRILGVALALAALVPASYAVTVTTSTSATNVTGITNLLSALPAEYSVDGPRTGGLIFGGAGSNVSTLTNGQALVADVGGGAINNATNQFAVVGGDILTYSLGGTFDLTQVDIYSSWNDANRNDFTNVTIEFSADGTNYFNLVTGINSGTHGGFDIVDTRISAGGAVIAAGATNVRFTFNGLENNAIGISELAVQGTSAIPEPSTYAAIFGVLALGAAAYRRRKARA